MGEKSEKPVFTLLLIALRPDVKMMTRHLWQSIDELVIKPIEKVEVMEICWITPDLLATRWLMRIQKEIAERRRVEAALAKNEAKFRALVQILQM